MAVASHNPGVPTARAPRSRSQTFQAPIGTVRAIDEEKGQITALVSTDQVDRYGDVIVPSAYMAYMDRYMSNPQFLWQHNRNIILGAAVAWKILEEGLEVTFQFDLEDAFAANIFRLYTKKFLRAFSIGGLIHDWVFQWSSKDEKSRVPDKYRQLLEDKSAEAVILELELYEVSGVTVPANPGALARAVAEGVITREFAAELQPETTEAQAQRGADEDMKFDEFTKMVERAEKAADRLEAAMANAEPEKAKQADEPLTRDAIREVVLETIEQVFAK